jgi:hypothetical protein
MIIYFICPTSYLFHYVPFCICSHHRWHSVHLLLPRGVSSSSSPLDTTPKIILYFIRDNKQTSNYYSIVFILILKKWLAKLLITRNIFWNFFKIWVNCWLSLHVSINFINRLNKIPFIFSPHIFFVYLISYNSNQYLNIPNLELCVFHEPLHETTRRSKIFFESYYGKYLIYNCTF